MTKFILILVAVVALVGSVGCSRSVESDPTPIDAQCEPPVRPALLEPACTYHQPRNCDVYTRGQSRPSFAAESVGDFSARAIDCPAELDWTQEIGISCGRDCDLGRTQ